MARSWKFNAARGRRTLPVAYQCKTLDGNSYSVHRDLDTEETFWLLKNEIEWYD